jgi:hypothetical protein
MISGKQTAIFLSVTIAVALIVATPAISHYVVFPKQESRFTEFWLLGPDHTADNLPYNTTSGSAYSIYLGIANHLGYTGYYHIEVKLRNYTEPGPNDTLGTPSGLPSIFRIPAFVPDKESREVPLSFSFNYSLNLETQKASFSNIILNDVTINLAPWVLSYNLPLTEYDWNLFFELWIYDSGSNSFQYHGQSLGIHLNAPFSITGT